MKNIFQKIYQHKKTTVLIGLAVLIVVGGLVLTTERHGKVTHKDTEKFRVEIPVNYTEPLVIASFGNLLNITPLEAKSVEKIEEGNNTIRYIEAYQDTDVEQIKYPNKLKESLILKGPDHPDRFEYELGNLGDYEWEFDQDNNLVFYTTRISANTNTDQRELRRVFTIPEAYMFEQAQKDAERNAEKRGRVEMVVEGNKLILIPDKDWIENHSYPIIVDPTVEINILNVQSYPVVGGNWEVRFTARGQGDLKITGMSYDDYRTVFDLDVRMLELRCEDLEFKIYDLKDNYYIFEDFRCDGVASLVVKVLKPGKHHLRFDFEGEIGDAYNDASPSDPWWNSSWLKRRPITINNATSTSALTNFPALVSIMQEDAVRIDYANTQGSGQDIRFVNYNGTELDYEIEKWDETATSTLWVKIPSIEGATTTQYFYMYYGNSGATDNATTTGVWDDNFVLVQHLEESDIDGGVDDITDSTKYYNHGMTWGMDGSDAVEAKIDGGFDFDGSNDNVSIGSDSSLQFSNGKEITISAWVNMDDYDDYSTIVGKVDKLDTNKRNYLLYLWTSSGEPKFIYRDSGNANWHRYAASSWTPGTGSWAYVAFSYTFGTGASAKIYGDGSQQIGSWDLGDGSAVPWSEASFTFLGCRYNDFEYDGVMDEVRISDTIRSADWIAVEYESMTDDYLSFGAEESALVAPAAGASSGMRIEGTQMRIQGKVRVH